MNLNDVRMSFYLSLGSAATLFILFYVADGWRVFRLVVFTFLTLLTSLLYYILWTVRVKGK